MFVMAGCQDSEGIVDNGPQNQKQFIPSQVSVISEDQNSIYQIDVKTEEEDLTENNLTNSIGAITTYRSMYVNGSQVGFIYQDGKTISALFKDVISQETQTHDLTSKLDDPYNGINFGNSVEDYLLLFNRSGPDYMDLSVLALNVRNGTSRKITFGRGTSYSSRILYENDWLLIKYTDANGKGALSAVNLASGIVNTKRSNDSYFAFLDKGQLHMLFCTSDNYEIYDVSNLSLVENRSLEICSAIIDWNWRLGLNKSQVDGNHLLVDVKVPQPSPDAISPGVYDLSTGEMVEDQLISSTIRLELYDLYPQSSINLINYTVNLAKEQVVFGYQRQDSNGIVSGGLVFTNFNGDFLKDIPLIRPPKEIIITEP
jgi:hypothetical protein